MTTMASQITSLTVVYSTVYSDAHRSKKTSKLRVTGLCVGNSPGPVNSPHKGPVPRKMFPFDDVIMMIIKPYLRSSYGYSIGSCTPLYLYLWDWAAKMIISLSLQWRHNGRDGISNHMCLDGLLNRLLRRRTKKTSKLRTTDLCEGN